MTKDELLKSFLEIGIIQKEKVILRSGEVSEFYCDIKKAYGYPDILNTLADKIIEKLSTEITCIAASGYGGLPLGAVVASRSNLKFAAVRSSVKDHGKQKIIDGYTPGGNDLVVIVDDVLTSGSSIKETLTSLQTTEAQTLSAIVVVKRGDPELPIPYSQIFTIDEILT